MDSTKAHNRKIEIRYIVSIIIAIILGTSILGYGYLDYKYKIETLEEKRKSEELSRQEKETKKANLNDCLNAVNERVTETLGDNKNNMDKEGIMLIHNIAKDQKDECFKKYR